MYLPISTVEDSQHSPSLQGQRFSGAITSSGTSTAISSSLVSSNDSALLLPPPYSTTAPPTALTPTTQTQTAAQSSSPLLLPSLSPSCVPDDFHVKVVLIGSAPMTVSCRPDIKVSDLKRLVFSKELNGGGNSVRMIYLGRVIKNDSLTLQELGIENGHALHAFITEKENSQNTNTQQTPHSNTTSASGSSSGSGSSSSSSSSTESDYLNGLAIGAGDIDGPVNELDESAIAIGGGESAWAAERRGGDLMDLICGFGLGIVLGPLALIWLMNRQVPFRQKTGIIFGIMANLTLYFWNRNELQQQQQQITTPTHSP